MLDHPALARFVAPTAASQPRRYTFPLPVSATASTLEELERLFQPPLWTQLADTTRALHSTAVDWTVAAVQRVATALGSVAAPARGDGPTLAEAVQEAPVTADPPMLDDASEASEAEEDAGPDRLEGGAAEGPRDAEAELRPGAAPSAWPGSTAGTAAFPSTTVPAQLASIYLDTTYCRPQHAFPPQEDVVAFVRCTCAWFAGGGPILCRPLKRHSRCTPYCGSIGGDAWGVRQRPQAKRWRPCATTGAR